MSIIPRHYLDFEKPIAELETKLGELETLAEDAGQAGMDDNIAALRTQIGQLRLDAYSNLSPWQKAEPADDRLVVAVLAVALQLDELVDQAVDIVYEMRTLGMACDFRFLPGREVGVGVAAQVFHLDLQRGDVVVHAALVAGVVRQGLQFAELGLELRDGPFEIQVMAGDDGHQSRCAVGEGRRLRRDRGRSQAQAPDQRLRRRSAHPLRASGCLVCTTSRSRSSATWV